jgi:hypothetical protein
MTGFAIVLLVPTASARAQAPGFVEPTARVDTIAGGGTRPPRDGRPATEARLRIARVATAPDGSIVFTEESGTRAGWRIDLDGRLRSLPPILVGGERVRARDIDVAPDGTLLAVVGTNGSIHRLSSGATVWVASPPLHGFGFDEIAALPDGGALVGASDHIWRLGPSGDTIWRRRGPPDEDGQPSIEHLVGLPGDGVAAIGANGVGVSVLEGDGRRRRLRSGFVTGLTALADGTLVEQIATGAMRLRPPGGRPRTLFGLTPRLGRGDGGPARGALFEPGVMGTDALAVGRSGELIVADDVTLDARGDVDMEAFRFGRALVTHFDVPQRRGELLRVVGSGSQPTVAIRPTTYRTIARRRIAVSSSFAGLATLRAFDGGRLVAALRARVPAGDSSLTLRRRLAPADYRLELTVADASRHVTHRVGLSTRRRLNLARARRTIRRVLVHYQNGGDGSYYELQARGCRTTALQLRCALWSYYEDVGDDPEERCAGRVTARQRPDGLRVLVRQRRSLCGRS